MPPRTQKKKTKECYNGSTSTTTNTSLIINVAVYLLALGLLIFYKNSMDYTCFVVIVTVNLAAIFGLVNIPMPIIIGLTILLSLLCRRQ
tara:strand:+ start:375 stop:641 length:267 start_codon:yes stop_codon:yes gene_type:complete